MSHTSFFTSDLSGFDLVTTLHSIVIYKGLFTWLMRMALVTTLHSIVIYKIMDTTEEDTACNYPSFYCHIQGVNDK